MHSYATQNLSGQIFGKMEACILGILKFYGRPFVKSLSKSLLLAATALAPLTVALPGVAHAQDAEAATEDEGGLEEIIVTARRTEETLQDTPVAVSVVTADQIAEKGLTSIDDFARQSTGISFSQAFGRFTDRPVIRGASNVLANVQFGVETGAAYFVDGVYYQGDLQSFDPNEIQRVEIVKGPQSALYGRNTYAGAINYITKDPSNDYEVTGRGRIAEHGELDFGVSVSGPLIEDLLSFRVGGRYYNYEGEFKNNITGKTLGKEESESIYATLVFTPHTDLKIRTRIGYQRDNDGARPFFLQGAAANNCLPGFRSAGFRAAGAPPVGLPASTNRNQWFCGVVQSQPNNIYLNTDPATYTLIRNGAPVTVTAQDGTAYDGIFNAQINVSNIIEWDIAGTGWLLAVRSGYRKNKNSSGSDSDHSEAFTAFGPGEPLFTISDRDKQVDYSHEIKLRTPDDNALRAMVGGYYFKQRFQSRDYVFADPTARTGRILTPLGANFSNYATIENKALFGMLEWDVTDNLTISGELRSATETKQIIERSSVSATAVYIFSAGMPQSRQLQFGCTEALRTRAPTPGCVTRPAGKWEGLDPRITINYQTDSGLLFYANYASGRKPGGFNGTAGITAQALLGRDASLYAPEKSKGFELGMKFEALDRRLRGSVALYRNTLSNVQLSTAIPNLAAGGSLTSIVTTTANARTQGIELDLQAAPTDNLTLNAGISYVDAKFRSGCDADLFIYNSGGLRPNFDTANPPAAGLALCDITGKRLPLSSPFTANGSATYEIPVSDMFTIVANSTFSYEGKKNVQTDNLAKVGSTFLLNARIGFKTDNFTLSVFGRNLTNEDSVPLATRWFDLRYGSSAGLIPAGQTFNGSAAFAETGSPRGLFAMPRRTRNFGIEGTFTF
jgi:outer membrane receptor protein involved in Fe transport